MNFKTIPVAAALLGAVSLSSFAIAATDNVDTAAVRGFDTVASRPAADIPPCPYYDDFKAELGIDGVPTFIYYKDGEQVYQMDSPVTPGYFEESGQDRVDAYNLMAEKIGAFIMGCADDNPEAVEEFDKEHEAETAYDDGSEEETSAAEETTESETTVAEKRE